MNASNRKPKLLLRLLLREAENLEHLRLDMLLMDTDAAAADLGTVEHDIVSLRAHAPGIAVQILPDPLPSAW